MNFEEAIKTAIELEESIRDIYRENAKNLKSEIAANVFNLLADEEAGHVKFLYRKLEQWEESGAVTLETLETALPNKELIEQQLEESGYRRDVADIDNEVALFKQALEMETNISKFYREMVTVLPENEVKLFRDFLAIEECHEAVIQAEISSAIGSGVWFDIMEFDQEAG